MAAAVLTRLIAVTFLVAGVGFTLYRRGYRPTVIFAACSAPIVCLVLFLQGTNEPLEAWASGGDAGFRQTWLYYTSYGDFWKLSVPDLDHFLTMLGQNTILFLLMPASYFLFLGTEQVGALLSLLAHLAVTFAVFHGLFRHGKANGWSAVHLVVPLYSRRAAGLVARRIHASVRPSAVAVVRYRAVDRGSVRCWSCGPDLATAQASAGPACGGRSGAGDSLLQCSRRDGLLATE